MTDAPERIQAWPYTDIDPDNSIPQGNWYATDAPERIWSTGCDEAPSDWPTKPNRGAIEYIRADKYAELETKNKRLRKVLEKIYDSEELSPRLSEVVYTALAND